MKYMEKFQVRLLGITKTITRFSLTTIFILITTVFIGLSIHNPEELYEKLIITFAVGSLLSIVSQTAYERFFYKAISRLMLMGVTAILTGGYYLLLNSYETFDVEISIRTTVIIFALFIAFLWIPTIKSKISFNDSFMAAFKAFFISIFFSGVLFLGVILIIGAIDNLIISVDEDLYLHAANIIFAFFAPIYLLSLIPVYHVREDNIALQKEVTGKNKKVGFLQDDKNTEEVNIYQEELIKKATSATKFLETLISFVIIPVTAVFTIILLLYIIMNITGSFWTDNLLEPMLVSYSIIVIIVYLLAARIDHVFSRSFRRVFPKVLVPIVLFQTISSIIKIGDLGITYGRYYVILFGVFATIAGILFSFIPVQKNGIIAPILLVLAFLSIMPPVDAFTVSRINQTGRLEKVLRKNNMLEGTSILPKDNISEEDQNIIVKSVNYLDSMHYTDDIVWMASYLDNNNFQKTFGFTQYGQIDREYKNSYFYLSQGPIPITGYDYMLRSNVYETIKKNIGDFEKNGITFSLQSEYFSKDKWDFVLYDENNKELIRYSIPELFQQFDSRDTVNAELSIEEATFTKDNELATLTLIVQTININQWQEGKEQTAEVYLLVSIKE